MASGDAVHSTTRYTRLFNYFKSYSVILFLVGIILPYMCYFSVALVIVVLVSVEN